MTGVKFPSMRREVLSALASLADVEYQRRVWVRREGITATYFDDLNQNVHVLYDDAEVLPDPEARIGSVLIDGEELTWLRQLDESLSPLIDELGDAPDDVYLAHARWASVVRAAVGALAAMARAGALDGRSGA